ncbi:MAG: hypothetical protein DMD48_04835 [Gemmatimonadetes bacterium]|nr:MAG: hypothetical protein DMD48_04835 [Gemmatimonadota bacterium]
MVTYRKEMHIGAIVAVAMLAAQSLAAQGGAQQRRAPLAAVSAAASTDAAGTTGTLTLQLAGELLKTLAGKWRFEVRFAGNFTGAPDGSGTRVFAALFDSLRLEWRETVDSSSASAQGIMGFDPNNGRFYSTAVYSSGSGVELLTGSLDMAEPFVAFNPAVACRSPSARFSQRTSGIIKAKSPSRSLTKPGPRTCLSVKRRPIVKDW